MAIVERYENEADIPEENKEDYTKYDDDGKEVYVLTHLVGALNAKNHEKAERKKTAEALKAMEDKLAEQAAVEKKRQEELEEARRKQLENDGKWEELKKLEEEKRLTDKRAAEEKISTLELEIKSMREAIEREKISAYCGKISADIALDGANEALQTLIEIKRTKMVDGNLVILNRNGEAVTWDKDQLIDDIKSDPFFAHLIQGSKATGGGSTGGGGGAVNKPLEEMTEPERVQLFKDNPTKFRELVAAAKNKGK